MTKIKSEQQVVELMIRFYCKRKHSTDKDLCSDCKSLLDYARHRLLRCPFQEEKPVCKRCHIHCYKPDMRQNIKKVMRFSGPRMLFFRPLKFILHLLPSKE